MVDAICLESLKHVEARVVIIEGDVDVKVDRSPSEEVKSRRRRTGHSFGQSPVVSNNSTSAAT